MNRIYPAETTSRQRRSSKRQHYSCCVASLLLLPATLVTLGGIATGLWVLITTRDVAILVANTFTTVVTGSAVVSGIAFCLVLLGFCIFLTQDVPRTAVFTFLVFAMVVCHAVLLTYITINRDTFPQHTLSALDTADESVQEVLDRMFNCGLSQVASGVTNHIQIHSVCIEHVRVWFLFATWMLIGFTIAQIVSLIAVLAMSALLVRMNLNRNTDTWTIDTSDEYPLNHEDREGSSRETVKQNGTRLSVPPTAPPITLECDNSNQRTSVTSNHIVCPHCHQHNIIMPL